MKGRLQIETLSSLVLKGNPLGDPTRREIPVYLPPGFGETRGKRFGLIVYLPGFTGGGRSVVNYNPWKENLVERFDRLVASGKAAPAVLAIADGFTAFGGAQYVNSSATGRYEDHIAEELVPFLEDKLGIGGRPEARAVVGKSSGGFGALHLAMARPGLFGHLASHSGDMGFDVCYGPDILKFCAVVDRGFGGSAERFARAFLASRKKDSFDHSALNVLAMSACYSPNPRSPVGFDVPCEVRTAALRGDVWRRWLAFDPVELAGTRTAALKRLKTLFFDCGRRDEFFLQFGARRLALKLKALGVRHIHEEHDGGHFDMNERYDRSLALLSKRLA